jgi:hypothetical protein
MQNVDVDNTVGSPGEAEFFSWLNDKINILRINLASRDFVWNNE